LAESGIPKTRVEGSGCLRDFEKSNLSDLMFGSQDGSFTKSIFSTEDLGSLDFRELMFSFQVRSTD